MSPGIFFSYSRFDSAFVLKLASDLRAAGATVWLDQLDISPGKHWDTEIEDALQNANCLLAIVSPKSLESDNVMDEISYALEEKKKVIPVLLTDTCIPFRLRRLQRVDFTGDYQSAFKQLLTSINIEDPAAKTIAEQLPGARSATETTTIATLVREKEDYMWERCCYLNTIAAYQEYLRSTPLRQHVDEAWSKITSLEQETGIQTRHAFTAKRMADKGRKKRLLLLVGVVGLIGVMFGAYKIFAPRYKRVITADQSIQPNPASTGADTNDSITSGDNSSNTSTTIDLPAPATENEIAANNKAGIPVSLPSKKKRETNITSDNRNKNNSSADSAPELNSNRDIPAAEDPAPKATPAAPVVGQVTINSKVIIQLELLDALDMDQKKKSPQKVRFAVITPVHYQGHTIIRKGATAYGSITVGSRLTDLVIDEVQTANGKMLPLKSEHNRGKVKDIIANKTFTAIIKEGAYYY